MSQILDAIEKAERARKQSTSTNDDKLYRNLGKVTTKPRLPTVLSMIIVILSLGLCGAMYNLIGKKNISTPQPQQTKTKPVSPEELSSKKPSFEKAHKQPIKTPTDKLSSTPSVDARPQPATKKTAPMPLLAITPEEKTTNLLPLTPIASTNPKQNKTKPDKTNNKAKHKQASGRQQTSAIDSSVASNRTAPKPVQKPNRTPPPSQRITNKTTKKPSKKTTNSPPIKITAIVYHQTTPAKSFVLVSGKKITVGEAISGTPYRIISIMPKSIIVNDGNTDMVLSPN